MDKPRNIGFTKIDKKEYILKTEDVLGSLSQMSEYVFYKKTYKKIYENKLNLNLQVPIEYKICKNAYSEKNKSKKTRIYYLFYVLKGDLTRKFVETLSMKNMINMYEQYLLSLFFLNHELGYFHNDLFTNYKFLEDFSIYNLNNLMYMNNPNKGKKTGNLIKVDKFKLKVLDYRAVIIDFGLASKFPNNYNYKLKLFYGSLSFRLFYRFKYYSEVFLLFVLLYHTYKGNFRLFHIKNFYQFFESKMFGEQSLIEFDRAVYKYFKVFLLEDF